MDPLEETMTPASHVISSFMWDHLPSETCWKHLNALLIKLWLTYQLRYPLHWDKYITLIFSLIFSYTFLKGTSRKYTLQNPWHIFPTFLLYVSHIFGDTSSNLPSTRRRSYIEKPELVWTHTHHQQKFPCVQSSIFAYKRHLTFLPTIKFYSLYSSLPLSLCVCVCVCVYVKLPPSPSSTTCKCNF